MRLVACIVFFLCAEMANGRVVKERNDAFIGYREERDIGAKSPGAESFLQVFPSPAVRNAVPVTAVSSYSDDISYVCEPTQD